MFKSKQKKKSYGLKQKFTNFIATKSIFKQKKNYKMIFVLDFFYQEN